MAAVAAMVQARQTPNDSDPDDDPAIFYHALDSLELPKEQPRSTWHDATPTSDNSGGPKVASSAPAPRPMTTAWSMPSASAVPSSADFPSLASTSTQPSSKKRAQASPWTHYSDSRRPFNPYPSRRQELVRRTRETTRSEGVHGRSTPPKKRHTGLSGVQTLAALLDQHAREAEQEYLDEDDVGPVSARGASMASLTFRDLTSSSAGGARNRRFAPGYGTAGLMAFGAGSFGGEPLKVLDHMDDELGAAHMGPRIYARNPKAPQRIRSEADRWKGNARKLDSTGTARDDFMAPPASTAASAPRIQEDGPLESERQRSNETTTRALCQRLDRVMDGITDGTDFIALLNLANTSLVLQDLEKLTSSVESAARIDDYACSVLARLLRLRLARPMQSSRTEDDKNSERLADEALKQLLSVFTASPFGLELLGRALSSSASASAGTGTQRDGDPLFETLVTDLVGVCGRCISASTGNDPSASPDAFRRYPLLLQCCIFLRLLFQHNKSLRQRGARSLPLELFYCVMVDTTPFLEDFVELAHRPSRAQTLFNVCQFPFLLSLGAKARILQFENGMRAGKAVRDTSRRQAVTTYRTSDGNASLSSSSQRLSLSVHREQAYTQSAGLLLQLLDDDESTGDFNKPVRVEFLGEDAADGGGPTREWFATVSKGFPQDLVDDKGCFSSSTRDDTGTAEFLGVFLGLAAFHGVKVSLPFDLPAFVFKLVYAASLDESLDLHDLAEVDEQMVASLRQLLEWSPGPPADDGPDLPAADQFDSIFGLSWSVDASRRDSHGGVYVETVDLVPGGRHRSLRLADREQYVRRLVRYHLVDTVKAQIDAFRRGWASVMPVDQTASSNTTNGIGAMRNGREAIARGGLALSLLRLEELRSIICSRNSSQPSGHRFPARDVGDGGQVNLDVKTLRLHTQHIFPRAEKDIATDPIESTQRRSTDAVDHLWSVWEALDWSDQRRLLAFITGSEDLPVTGARALGLRIHLVELDAIVGVAQDDGEEVEMAERRKRMPLPWSSTCTLTLFLPNYPHKETMEIKVRKAIEHWRGFGLR